MVLVEGEGGNLLDIQDNDCNHSARLISVDYILSKYDQRAVIQFLCATTVNDERWISIDRTSYIRVDRILSLRPSV